MPVQLYGGGVTTRDFVFVEDTANAVVKILQADDVAGEIFHVASGTERSMRDVVGDIADLMGVEPEIEELPSRQGDVRGLRGSMEKAKSRLGIENSTSWKVGLQRCIDYYSV
jgi:UDP-glucose 4-epimerase